MQILNTKVMKSRYFIFVTLLVLVSNNLFSQKRPLQTIRRVTVTNQYIFENGKQTNKYVAVYQEIFDSLNRLHTEIEYGIKDLYPHNYIWHTFNGKQKVRSEYYKNEKLVTIEEFSYNTDSLISKKIVKKVGPGDTSIFYIISYKYDLKKNKIEENATTVEGKLAYSSKSTYNDKGKELTRKVKVKKNFYPQDSILKLVDTPVYDSIGRLIAEKIIYNKVNKENVQKNIKYSYDKKNNQVGLLELDLNGKQIRREERFYNFSRNRLSSIKYFNSDDVLVNMIAKRYEIYRTSDRRVREIDS